MQLEGKGETGKHVWVCSLCVVDEAPHPHAGLIVGSKLHATGGPHSLEDIQRLIFTAIVKPGPRAGSPRKPRGIVFAWRMRQIFPELKRLLEPSLGIALAIEDRKTAAAIAAAHGTDIEGWNFARDA